MTAIGTSAAYPGPDNACSGWLVQAGETSLLIDCGTGVVSRLQKHLPLERLTGIIISHIHADHFFDLFPLRYAYKYGLGLPDPRPLLFLPPGGEKSLVTVASALDAEGAAQFFPGVFDTRCFEPEEALQAGGLTLTFAPGVHYVPSWAIAVEADGRRVVFTADTGPSSAVESLARGADLLVSEATYLSVEEDQGGRRGHLTGQEAGELARAAQPARVLLTHQWPNRDRSVTLRQAASAFDGTIALAEPGRTYDV